ncbi:MAG: hypothetical protein ACI82S_000256 [Patiriisocius sp.]|jgi:hypothetical protein
MLMQLHKSNDLIIGMTNWYKRITLIAGLLFVSTQVCSQDASDIWIGKLNLWEKEPVTELVQITDTAQYSNQPYFFDNERLFFTQAMVVKGSKTQMDAWVFDFKDGKSKNVTQSSANEYSPTPLLNKSDMSVIRVNDQGKQELWQIDLLGKTVQHLAPLIEPVGYQVWLNNNELLLFVLGEPNTLQRVDVLKPESMGSIVDTNIGASLHRFEKTDWFLYTSNLDGNFLNAYNKQTNKTIQIVSMPKNSEYFSVSRMGNVITSDGETLWQRKFMLKGDRIEPLNGWQVFKITQAECSSGVTRTAISPDTSMIALVCPRS